MNAVDKSLTRLPAREPATVLAELHAITLRARRGEVTAAPELTVTLVGGGSLRGHVIDLQNGVLLLATGTTDATYIPTNAVAAVTAHLSPENAHLLSFGTMRERPREAPSRLQLEREAAAIATTAGERLGRPLSVRSPSSAVVDVDDARAALAVFLGDLRHALGELTSTEIGREALREAADGVRIGLGSSFGVALKGRVLEVTLVEEGSDLRWSSRTELLSALERVL